jgi:hypothetical protein
VCVTSSVRQCECDIVCVSVTCVCVSVSVREGRPICVRLCEFVGVCKKVCVRVCVRM